MMATALMHVVQWVPKPAQHSSITLLRAAVQCQAGLQNTLTGQCSSKQWVEKAASSETLEPP